MPAYRTLRFSVLTEFNSAGERTIITVLVFYLHHSAITIHNL